MKKLLFVLMALYGCTDLPQEAPLQNAMENPEATPAVGGNDFPGTLGKKVPWNIDKYFYGGDQADANSRDNNEVYLYVYVNRDQTPSGTRTWLNYYVYSSSSGQTLEEGWGEIPNQDLTGSYAQGSMHLSTNTSASSNPNFYRYTGSGGPINIDWQINGDWESENNGYYFYQSHIYNYIFASKGRSWRKSSSISGQLINWNLPGSDWSNADVGTYKNMGVNVYFGN